MHGGKTAEAENPYSIEVSHDLEDRGWDEFVSRCPGGHHEQTSLWAQVKSHYGWRPVRGIVARNGELAGGFQLLTKPFKWGGKIGYVSRGPVSICQDPRLLGAITDEVDRLARKEGIQYLVVVPSYIGHAFGSHFKDRGYLPKPEHLPPTGIPEATLILDLGLDNDQILSHMRPEIRRVVKNGYRQGMTVREGAAQDVETFRRMMWALCERRGTSPSPPQKDFFQHVWRVFHPPGAVRLLFSEYEGRPISGALLFTWGDSARLWKVGWAGDQAKRSPTQVLWWEAIQRARKSGSRYFDIVGIDLAHAEAILRGEKMAPSKEYGTTFFKTSFGGNVTLLPRPLFKIYNPMVRFVVNRWGRQIVRLKFMNRAGNI